MNGTPAPLGIPQDILNRLNAVDGIINTLTNDPAIQPGELRRIQSYRNDINDILSRYKSESEGLLKRYNDRLDARLNQLNQTIDQSRSN